MVSYAWAPESGNQLQGDGYHQTTETPTTAPKHIFLAQEIHSKNPALQKHPTSKTSHAIFYWGCPQPRVVEARFRVGSLSFSLRS